MPISSPSHVELLTTILLHAENIMYLFPETSNVDVTFTAHANPNTWSAWAEIIDGNAVTLSSKFATLTGYLRGIMLSDASVANEIYIIELSYGTAKTIVGRVAVRSDWTYRIELISARIPAGETVYYRMMAETGGATILARFRYYYL